MLQLQAWSLSAALFFISQCRFAFGSSLKIKQVPSAPLPYVSNTAAASWLEQALWGPAGASQWRHHGLLEAHRLGLNDLKMLHVLPEEQPEQAMNRSIVAPTQKPQPRVISIDNFPLPTASFPSQVSDAEANEETAGEEDERPEDHIDYDNDDDQEDVLSAGLRSKALEKERFDEERRAARKRRRAEKRARKAAVVHALAIKKRAARNAARNAKLAKARAEASVRSGQVVGQINGMLAKVVEEMELEKSRCETYMRTAKKETSDAREISTEDQERLAYIDTVLHSSRAEQSDLQSQGSDLKEQLAKHKSRCTADVGQLKSELGTLKTDTDTTAKIMQASPCKGETLLLECEHRSGKPFIAARHRGLRQVMAQLSTSTARRSLQRALRHAVKHKRHHDLVLLQRTHHRRLRHRGTEQHRSQRRGTDRCAAARMDCQQVETAIVLMMADVQDKQHTTKVALDKTTSECDAATTHLEAQIAHLEERKQTLSLHVAQVMSEKSGLGGEVSLRLDEYDRQVKGMSDVKKECESSAQAYEKQICSLKKSRQDIQENNGMGLQPEALRDCEVSPWSPAESCSQECGGGVQRLIRTVVTPNGEHGMPCPALETQRACNVQSCPLDCKVTEWTAWTQCSALCGGGTRSRDRKVLQMAQHGGQICPGENGISEACNTKPCVEDCALSGWTPWTQCSRACNGGFQRRQRLVTEPARGNAICPTEEQREEFAKCTGLDRACPAPLAGQSLKCNSAVDLIVVMDGSALIDPLSFAGEKDFVLLLLNALNMVPSKSQAALILAGGPKAWTAFEKCKLDGSAEDALESCNVATKLPLSADGPAAIAAVNAMVAPGGPAYTAGALSLAANQVEQSRPEATPVVLVVGHGRPLSESRTSDEAAKIRDKARLMWLVVGGAHADKNPIAGARVLSAELASTWASRPYSDNVFQAKTFKDALSLETVSDIVSAVCPSVVA